MEKIIKKILFVLTVVIGLFIKTNSVNAATLDLRYQDNVYYIHVDADGSNYSSFQLAMFYVDNKLAYCVEPGLMINSMEYGVGDWNVTNLSPSQRLRIEQIGYFGYEYPGHQNVRYYMAAQELIWQTIRPIYASWYTGPDGSGSVIDISTEKNEIEYLISRSNTKPSFHKERIEAVIGDEIILNDTNNVLNQYTIFDNEGQDVNIDGNQLKIKINNTGDKQIKFIISNYDNDINLVYYNSNSQTLAHTRLSDPFTSILDIHSTAGKVTINKKDKDNKKSIPQGEASLEGAIYDIFNDSDELITTIVTDSEGKITSDFLPSLGHYYLKERVPSIGYTLDENKYEFDMTLDNLYPLITVYEKVIEREYNFIKVYASSSTGIMKPEAGIRFGFYNNKNELIKEISSNNDGLFKIVLPYGSYTVKQLTSSWNYEYIDDFVIHINEIGEPITKVLSNAEITAKLHVIKVDSETGEVIKRKGIKFKIYSIDNDEYICQNISYPNRGRICVFETDEKGEFITPEILHSGKYRLEELDQKIDGYLWNSESKEFEIGENSELKTDSEYGILFEVTFENKRVKGRITIDKVGEVANITDNGYEYTTKILEGIKFGLFSKDGKLLREGYTNENGTLIFEDVELGEYYIQELETIDNYILADRRTIELNYINQYTPIIEYQIYMVNKIPKGTLEFTKIDFSTSQPLPNTKVEIYNENDELIYTGITDSNGKLIIENLPVGKYYILEKEAPDGYILNNEKMFFEIKLNGEVVKSSMKNQKVIQVPNTDSIKNYKFEIIAISICFIGIVILILAAKYGKK